MSLRPQDTEKDVPDIEKFERKDDDFKTGNVVADRDARQYVNPDLVITEEENKVLRRKIHKR